MRTDYVGIGEAAEVLGLSRTSLQKLVDSGQLAAVKTAGGHRRIPREALEALRVRMGGAVLAPVASGSVPAGGHGARPMRVLLVEDDEVLVAQIHGLIEESLPDVECRVAGDGLEAVMQMERLRPDVLITDLQMEPFDGFRLLRLVGEKPEYRSISTLVISSLGSSEVQGRGGLPEGTILYQKPLQAGRLLGFLEAHRQMVVKREQMP
jgi:excisionase family DNA binding protein